MESGSISKTIAKGVFYAVAIVLILWTASLTYAFVRGALPHMSWYVPLLSLVVFDVGMIAWMFVFRFHAKGTAQRATAISLTLLDLIGVGLMVIAEILLGGQQLAAAPEMLGEWAIWGIGLWTVANTAAVVAFHLLSPDSRKDMALQSAKDSIWEKGLQQLKEQSQEQGATLAGYIAQSLMTELRAGLVNGEQPPVAAPLVAAAVEEQRQRGPYVLEPTGNGIRPTPPPGKS